VTLQARELVVHIGRHTVLDGVDLLLRAGEIVVLAGRNGAGKSTMLRCLAGVAKPTAGEVACNGTRLATMSGRLRARTLTLVEQETECPFEFTGRELVEMGRFPFLRRWQSLRDEDHAAVALALREVDAQGFCDRPVTTLSGGELRRIAIARALATGASYLLLDEPTANLDIEHALALLGLVRRLAQHGSAVAIATHDLNLVGPFATRLVVLHEGRVHAEGPPESVMASAAIARVFGVTAEAPSGFFPRSFRPLG
jgi:iron complex transport system ATP-binding protein